MQTDHSIRQLEKFAELMDSKFVIPGTDLRWGLDSLLGLIPGAGDTATLLCTAYLIGKAHSYKLPWHISALMIWNGFIDWLIGLIPFIGDIFDLGWKANNRNVALLKEHLSRQPAGREEILTG